MENGCEFAYLLASGIFSQAIFSKAGYNVLKEFRYEDMLDPYGKPIIWDYREHKITQLVYKKFWTPFVFPALDFPDPYQLPLNAYKVRQWQFSAATKPIPAASKQYYTVFFMIFDKATNYSSN